LLAEDPDPDAWVNALRAHTARPTAVAKQSAWQAVMVDRKIPPDALGLVGRSFWRPGQDELLMPYAEEYLQSLPEIGDAGMLFALCMSRGFYPAVGGEDHFLDRLSTAAGQDSVSPIVRQNVRELNDRRRRREAARTRG